MQNTGGIVETEIGYFSRDPKYDTEKPYVTSFPVDNFPGAKVNNHEWVFYKSVVGDVRDKFTPSLDIQGFQYLNWKTEIGRPDFEVDETVKSRYYSELAEMIKQAFPRYKKLAFFDYAVRISYLSSNVISESKFNKIRIRDRNYPSAHGAVTTNSQPFRFAHVDYTEKGARMRLTDALGEGAEERLKTKCDILK